MSKRYKYSDLSDEALLLAYKSNRDSKLLGALLQRYTLLLLGVALKYLKDKTDAEDAVQQIFMKAIVHLPAENIYNFKGWLYILMRNYCLQLLRDRVHTSGEEQIANMPATELNKEEEYLKNYTLEQLQEAMQELGRDQKAVLQLFYFGRCSYQQIMDKTGLTFIQVKSYIQNGKRNLKNILVRKLGKADE